MPSRPPDPTTQPRVLMRLNKEAELCLESAVAAAAAWECAEHAKVLSVAYKVCLFVIRLVQFVLGYRAELGDDLLEKVVVDLLGEPRHQHPDAGLVRAIRLVRMAAPIIAGQSPRTCRMSTTACTQKGP